MLNKLALLLIGFYRNFISPLIGPRCRFTPTCSEYAKQSFRKFPFIQALWYSIRRISKCHPFHAGGHDPLEKIGCCHEH